jgi:hypothetical protein
MLATVETIKAMQLPAAMSYGLLAAGAWTAIKLVSAIWRGLLSALVTGVRRRTARSGRRSPARGSEAGSPVLP